ncbi:MAG: endonuclease/exonuclease/phosphatase, partial [Chitinophagaceae bacterium]|nr:endonuclease/exonuclease/phosphatase [Chitinophagaceae bacterium]
MRHILCCLLFSLSCSGLRAQQKQYPVAAVAFYNLENFFNPEDNPETNDEDFTPDGSHRYTEAVFRQKAKNMATVIAQLGTEYTPDGAAIVGVCEIEDDRVLKVLVQQPELKQRNYRYIRFDGPDKRGINVGLLYNPKYFRVLSAKPIGINLKFAGGGLTRDVLLVQGILLGDTVHILVNHWPSRSGGEAATAPKREAAAIVNKKAIAQLLAQNPQA